MFLLWDWLDVLYDLAKNIRRTTPWKNYKSYLARIFKGAHHNFCNASDETDLKNNANFCKQLNSRMNSLENNVIKHCKLKAEGCKEYCEQYCNHFVDMGTSEYHPKCPNKNQHINATNELLPADEDIENYLYRFVSGKNCFA